MENLHAIWVLLIQSGSIWHVQRHLHIYAQSHEKVIDIVIIPNYSMWQRNSSIDSFESLPENSESARVSGSTCPTSAVGQRARPPCLSWSLDWAVMIKTRWWSSLYQKVLNIFPTASWSKMVDIAVCLVKHDLPFQLLFKVTVNQRVAIWLIMVSCWIATPTSYIQHFAANHESKCWLLDVVDKIYRKHQYLMVKRLLKMPYFL